MRLAARCLWRASEAGCRKFQACRNYTYLPVFLFFICLSPVLARVSLSLYLHRCFSLVVLLVLFLIFVFPPLSLSLSFALSHLSCSLSLALVVMFLSCFSVSFCYVAF